MNKNLDIRSLISLKNYVNFDGRARRVEFWSLQLIYWEIFGFDFILFSSFLSYIVIQQDIFSNVIIF